MNYAFLPDLSALAILIVILLLMRRRHPHEQADIWLLGLLITLVESCAHIFYAKDGMPDRILHVVVLDCYLIAGLVFTWDSRRHPIPSRVRLIYLTLNTLPLLTIDTLYGLHISNPIPYFPAIASGLFIAGASSLYLRRTWLVTLVHLSGWLGIGLLIHYGEYRQAVYWSLSGVYAIAGIKYLHRLPRHSTGRLAILTGFFTWALCFFVHPFIVYYRAYADIASHVWNMQKTLITIGMILVMLEEQLSSNQWLAMHDHLTGLPNRRSFEDHLDTALTHCRRLNDHLALLIFDLDGFKKINDTLGHQAGDQILCGVAKNLLEDLPARNILARLGGDEFTLIAPDITDVHILDQLLSTIQNSIQRPILIDGRAFTMTASLGIAIYPDDAEDATKLLSTADRRMYALKQKPATLSQINLDVASAHLQ
ncbi:MULTISPECIES: GGDEF domain-containing protein [Acidobacteriaceae]|uniref:GGDEF domain-containing protein n=1 Tax=Acidobacteriaceae TaxID=204434 RepID=UPI00131C1270|nr:MULTISPECIES: GGDEF domain-containing protein [Acidobacteriaceae]MDW5265105.1 GGDEF domain-containing protein [Edaphobacter sp.]